MIAEDASVPGHQVKFIPTHFLVFGMVLSRSEAIVIVGRREYLNNSSEVKRKELCHSNNIRVHTYDWLLEQLRGAIGYGGPPRDNPYLLSRVELDNRMTDMFSGFNV